VIENRDAWEQRALSDKSGSYLIWSMQLFRIPIVKTPRKTKIMHFTKKQKNAQAFVNLHIRPIILFYKQYFMQDIFIRFYFLVKIKAGKVSINFTGNKGFHMLLQLCYSQYKNYLNESWCTRYVWLCWLTECLTGTFWLTDRDKAFKPGLNRLKRDVWYAYL